MANLNRYKFTFGNKTLTLTTEHDNLFMEEVERVAKEKYKAIKEQTYLYFPLDLKRTFRNGTIVRVENRMFL